MGWSDFGLLILFCVIATPFLHMLYEPQIRDLERKEAELERFKGRHDSIKEQGVHERRAIAAAYIRSIGQETDLDTLTD